eukprot:tig00001033_g6491.t1
MPGGRSEQAVCGSALASIANSAPSGAAETVAFTADGLQLRRNVYVIDVAEPERPRVQAVTREPEHTYLVEWLPDSSGVLVEHDTAGDERDVLYRVPLPKAAQEGSEGPSAVQPPEPLTPISSPPPRAPFRASPPLLPAQARDAPSLILPPHSDLNLIRAAGMRSAQMTPDGHQLYYFANYEFQSENELECNIMYQQDLREGTITALNVMEKPAMNELLLNEQADRILYSRSDQHPAGRQWYIMTPMAEEDTCVLDFGPEAQVEAGWHPDGRRLAFLTDSIDATRLPVSRAGIWTPSEGSPVGAPGTITWVGVETGLDFTSARFSKYDPHTLLLESCTKARTAAHMYDLRTGTLRAVVHEGGGSLLPTDPLPDGTWLARQYGSTSPATIARVKLSVEGATVRVTEAVPLFSPFAGARVKQSELVPCEPLEWTSPDGTAVHGWLYRSPAPDCKRAILYVHGGPTAHSEDALNVEIQWYVRRGFHVLDPNYRGSTGYGVAFREAIRACGWGAREQEDIAAGAEKLVAMGLVDGEGPGGVPRIGITGTSYGGFSSWCAISKHPRTFRAAAPVCGMTDLIVDYETTRPDLRPYSEQMMGGTPATVPERYRDGSPINFLHQVMGRVLIVQGMRDPNVHPSNVKAVNEDLKRYKVDAAQLLFPDEGHGILRKENQRIKLDKLAAFFAAALG